MQLKQELFTQNAWNAILSAKVKCEEQFNQYIETEHLFLSLLEGNELAKRIIEKSNGSINKIIKSLNSFLELQPKLNKRPEEVFVGKSLEKTIDEAIEIKSSFMDEFIAIEHIIIGLLKDSRCCKKILQDKEVYEDNLLKVVNGENPVSEISNEISGLIAGIKG